MRDRKLIVYLHAWHLTRSRAFHDLLIDPLGHYAAIEMRELAPDAMPPAPDADEQIAFCQVLPSSAWLRQHADRAVWLPMWDGHLTWLPHRWNALPKALRIVAFSEAVAVRTRRAGLRTLRLQFFQNPDSFPAATFERRTLLYWNRTGLLTEPFLRQFCAVMQVDHLIFRDRIDPYFPDAAHYVLPDRIGTTTVEPLPVTDDREAYWSALRRANLFIAPRAFEGAGSAFIEALASGCAVFARDAATMHEYITHGVDGALFTTGARFTPGVIAAKVRRRVAQRLMPGSAAAIEGAIIRLSMRQDWAGLARLDLAALGASARARHGEGYRAWRAAQDEYARFVLGGDV